MLSVVYVCVIFFFKQKTAYCMRISDWSSDVCSSDLDIISRPPRASGSSPFALANLEHGAIQGLGVAAILLGGYGWMLGLGMHAALELGRASCRERVGQYA